MSSQIFFQTESSINYSYGGLFLQFLQSLIVEESIFIIKPRKNREWVTFMTVPNSIQIHWIIYIGFILYFIERLTLIVDSIC